MGIRKKHQAPVLTVAAVVCLVILLGSLPGLSFVAPDTLSSRASKQVSFGHYGASSRWQKISSDAGEGSFARSSSRNGFGRSTTAALDRTIARAAEDSPEVQENSFTDSSAVQAGLFLTYFGLQSSMSFYMKWVLSKVKVASDLVGVPASFFVTATQQWTGFCLFLILIVGSRLIGKPYTPKPLASRKEWLLVLILSASFAANIGLNLLAISLVPLSLTMIIRGCSPLSTAVVQTLLMGKKQDIAPAEWLCVLGGVLCATIVVIAQSGGPTSAASFTFFFGVAMSVASLFCAAFDFVFKGILGTNVKLNAVDTVCYMAIPVGIFTTVFGCLVAKPVPATWAAKFAPTMTDLSVFAKLFEVNPAAFGYVVASGLLAFVYNTFVTFIVVKLSPATTAFAGNFNKAATILVSLLLLEGTLPTGPRGAIVLGGIIANIGCFTLYNMLKKRRQR